ncbi:hypothetical protein EB796_000878 [Bugula neritina]|uniref:PHD-type domain-containing protein n=1 Tax=Bugula neritina TaxID=10212 RepID=A0A7J7J5F4_BUGNE|nr:hypothetical protein EB796_021028 [Bugula neritina]KAF6040822.1 hypothetical protein EB796_000878 [Bugula neritina]
MIECDCCQSWYHSVCQNLSKTEATLISEGVDKGIKWFCHICKPNWIVKTNNQQGKSTEEKLDAINFTLKELAEKIDHHKSNLAGPERSYSEALKSHTERIVKTLDENTNNVKQQHLLLQQTMNQTDAESRKTNAILYGIKETPGQAVIEQVHEFMKHDCFFHTESPISGYRLGSKKQEVSGEWIFPTTA